MPKPPDNSSDAVPAPTLKTPPKAVTPKAKPTYPQPYGTRAEKSKGNKVGPAHQKRPNHKGR